MLPITFTSMGPRSGLWPVASVRGRRPTRCMHRPTILPLRISSLCFLSYWNLRHPDAGFANLRASLYLKSGLSTGFSDLNRRVAQTSRVNGPHQGQESITSERNELQVTASVATNEFGSCGTEDNSKPRP